ncbi:B-cell receptor CD22-like [Ascaphus truei]|uniref:B-cell receptor CD22-like n=1 Tax=Ascaphus truei TaxID=8439 RepID=UPI003F5A8FD6
MGLVKRILLFILLRGLLLGSRCQEWSSSVPHSIRALEGSCVVIPCTFTYPGPPREFSITWFLYRTISYPEVYNSKYPTEVLHRYYKRTQLVGDLGKQNCSIKIINVRNNDADIYYPWIDPDKNNFRFYDHPVQLQVSDFPEELLLKSPGVMTEGRSVTISCSAQHTCPSSPPTLQWDRFGSIARAFHKELTGGRWSVVSELTYIPFSEDHGSSLWCTAFYPSKHESATTIKLFINYSPKGTIVSVHEDINIKEGDTVTLTCSSNSNPAVHTYKWYHGQSRKPLKYHGHQITLRNISWDHGPYYCRAQNEVGEGESAPLDLPMKYPPKGIYIVSPEGHQVNEGKTVTLTCTVKSSMPAVDHYTWYRNQNQTLNQSQSILQLEAVSPDNSGDYHCVAHNSVGDSSSNPVHVDVIYAPKGTKVKGPVNTTYDGDILVLTCEFTSSNPEVTHYTWYKDDAVLLPESQKTLQIAHITATQSGGYRCVTHNGAGNSSSSPLSITVTCRHSTSHVSAAFGWVPGIPLVVFLLVLYVYMRRKKYAKSAGTRQGGTETKTLHKYKAQQEEKLMDGQPKGNIQHQYYTHLSDQFSISPKHQHLGPTAMYHLTEEKVKAVCNQLMKPIKICASKLKKNAEEVQYSPIKTFESYTLETSQSDNDEEVITLMN